MKTIIGSLPQTQFKFTEYLHSGLQHMFIYAGLLVECGKKWKIVWKILPNSAGNSAEKAK